VSETVEGLPLVLASTSPRRADLVRSLALPFTVLDPGVSDAAEAAILEAGRRVGLSTARIVTRVALAKLLAGIRRVPPGHPVLAADTVVAFDGVLLGKAKDREGARACLSALRGRRHDVVTGVALTSARGQLSTGVATSVVAFREFDDHALATFLDTGCWQGKAGAYGVQDPEAALLVERVEGSDSNARGLPLELVSELREG